MSSRLSWSAADTERVLNRLDRFSLLDFAEYHCLRGGTTLRTVVGPSRRAEIASVRHELWALLHGTLDMGWSPLGRLFGVHHTTVMTAVRRREAKLVNFYGSLNPTPLPRLMGGA